jgi:hypothetical protein
MSPLILPNRLNGNDYLNFLENEITNILDDLPLQIRRSVSYMQDGAPPHCYRDVTNYLNQNLKINGLADTLWPPRSSDLNPWDFYFWGHIKWVVYQTEIDNRNE